MDDYEIDAELRRLLGVREPVERPETASTTDKPRKIVVTHPDLYERVKEAVMALGHGDVLVVSNRWVPEGGQIYVMDPPPEVIQ